MIRDRFGGGHLSGHEAAVVSYEEAVLGLLRHGSASGQLAVALSIDPNFVAANALRGFFNVLLARQETMACARQDATRTAGLLAQNGGSASDIVLSRALSLAASGDFHQSIAVLRAYSMRSPEELLPVKLTHCLQFIAGRGQDMASFTGEVLSYWREEMAGYGYILGCHAFGLEESGQFRKAEAAAQAALHFDKHDLWAMHALAHVYEMNGRDREGIIWVESARDLWCDSQNFSFHLAWHLALFNLNIGKHERALAVYDADIRAMRSEDFRDIANAVSLLWRLRQERIDVGSRFDELADIARRRSADTTLVFASLHHLLSLVAVQDFAGASVVVQALENGASNPSSSQSAIARDIGGPLARAILMLARPGRADVDFSGLAGSLAQLGGSHAQRDVFLRTLALAAAERGDRGPLDVIWGHRHNLRREDRFLRFAEATALEHTGAISYAREVA